MLTIYIDADACPVKDEIYRVSRRYRIPVVVVAKAMLAAPVSDLVTQVTCPGFGEVDDWIAEHAGVGDLTITSDIPLAARCLEKGCRVLDPKGHAWTENDIGSALANRALMDELRQSGLVTGGPAARTAKDRSRFLAKLDETLNAILRAHPRPKSS
jgi:uncharacterized protein YaiI (UPF0178 family)